MPKSTKDFHKRKIAQAVVNMLYSMEYLKTVEDDYRHHHPELANSIEYARGGMQTFILFLEDFARVAWGVDEPDWYTWAEANRPRRQSTIEDEIIRKLEEMITLLETKQYELETLPDDIKSDVDISELDYVDGCLDGYRTSMTIVKQAFENKDK